MAIISFDRAVEYYDETRGFMPGVGEQIRDAIVAYTGASAATRFMEPGIGTGRIALPFVEAGYEYDGIDISIPMMSRLHQKLTDLATRHKKPRSAFRCGLAQVDLTGPLPLANASYDVLLAVHVFHLLPSWQNVLRECRRILRSKAWLLISTNNPPVKEPVMQEQAYDADTDVHMHWNAILAELGINRETVRPVNRPSDEEMSAFLQSLGARTEIVTLMEYSLPPLTPRQGAERLKARMYSSDWYLPDDIHAQAVQRLDRWLDTECGSPDTATQGTDTFRVLSAAWEG